VENTLLGYAEEEEEEISAFDLANFAKSITQGENVDEDNIDEWINCDANNPGFEHHTDKQIVGGALGMVSEIEEEENDEIHCTLKQVSHEAALRHIDELVQYLDEQDDTTLCDKMLLKNFNRKLKKSVSKQKNNKLLLIFLSKNICTLILYVILYECLNKNKTCFYLTLHDLIFL